MGAKGSKTKEMIREVAYTLFAQKGYKEVTMTDLCAATGLSRGGLYRHYSSTGEIFKEIISEEYSFDEHIKKGESAKSILLDALSLIEGEIMEKERSLSLAIYEYASQGNEDFFEKINRNAKNRWIGLLQYGIERKEFRSVDVERMAELILFYYQGLRMWSRVLPVTEETAQNYSETICEMLFGEK